LSQRGVVRLIQNMPGQPPPDVDAPRLVILETEAGVQIAITSPDGRVEVVGTGASIEEAIANITWTIGGPPS
jgi:hypothetical protein